LSWPGPWICNTLFRFQPDEFDSIDLDEVLRLRSLLESQQLKDLNTVLENYQNLFEEDFRNEYKIYDAYYKAFGITDPSYEELFKKWIHAFPDKWQPYLAIAEYYHAKGWENRGFKLARDTSQGQFENMQLYFSKAKENIETALAIKPDLMIGHNLLISIFNANGDDEAESRTINEAIELFPESFLIRSSGSWAKEPRWGGSYVEMEKIAKNGEKYSDVNPRLTILYGFIYYDQGRIFKRNKKYQEALDLFTKAISFGEHWVFYYYIAETYHFDLKEYDNALVNINRSIEFRPTMERSQRLRSRIYFAQGDYANSMADLHTAEMIKPGDPQTKKWKRWASNNLLNKGHKLFKTDLSAAIDNYNLSIEFDDMNVEAYYWRGMAYYRLEDLKSALTDFDYAIEINPRHFKSYRMVDYVLAKDQQWDIIIDYWDKFLDLEPEHAKAYYERSGTHYHNQDTEKALQDLKRSCELGLQEACKRLNKMTSK